MGSSLQFVRLLRLSNAWFVALLLSVSYSRPPSLVAGVVDPEGARQESEVLYRGGVIRGPGLSLSRVDPAARFRKLAGAWQRVDDEVKERYAPGSYRHVLILRPASTSQDLGVSGTYELWDKDTTGIYRFEAGSFQALPLDSSVSKADIDWGIAIGADSFGCFVSERLDSLMLYPGDFTGRTPRVYVRYYEMQVPSWTQGPQVVATAQFLPDARGMGQDGHVEVAPIPIQEATPAYPEYARNAGITGQVRLNVLVGADGRVKNIKTVQAVTGLNEASVNAAKRWKFQPARVGGAPVASWVTLVFRFNLP